MDYDRIKEKSDLIRMILADGEHVEKSFCWIYKFHTFILQVICEGKSTVNLGKIKTDDLKNYPFQNPKTLNNSLNDAFCTIIQAYQLFWDDTYNSYEEAENNKAIYQNSIVNYIKIIEKEKFPLKKENERFKYFLIDVKKEINKNFVNLDFIDKSANFLDSLQYLINVGIINFLIIVFTLLIAIFSSQTINEWIIPLYTDEFIIFINQHLKIYAAILIGVISSAYYSILILIKKIVKRKLKKRYIWFKHEYKLFFYRSQSQKQLYYSTVLGVIAILISVLVAYIQAVISF